MWIEDKNKYETNIICVNDDIIKLTTFIQSLQKITMYDEQVIWTK